MGQTLSAHGARFRSGSLRLTSMRLCRIVTAVPHTQTYQVHPLPPGGGPGGGWSGPLWRDVPALAIDNVMGDPPAYRPRVQAKLVYDPKRLLVIFRVEDRFVRSVVTRYQGPVCTDSCVELFFTPGADIGAGYFNIETNCGGTVLFMHQKGRGVGNVAVSAGDAAELSVHHSMPAVVDPEIADPTEWWVEYQVPYSVLSRYAPVAIPAPGVSWKANLYKCADQCSHPHWLTWSLVDWQRPDFHRPEFFGTLSFTR